MKYVEKTEDRRAPVAKPNPRPMKPDAFFDFVSKRYPKIIARLGE